MQIADPLGLTVYVVTRARVVLYVGTDEGTARRRAVEEATRYDKATEIDWRAGGRPGCEEVWYRREASGRWAMGDVYLSVMPLDEIDRARARLVATADSPGGWVEPMRLRPGHVVDHHDHDRDHHRIIESPHRVKEDDGTPYVLARAANAVTGARVWLRWEVPQPPQEDGVQAS